MSTFIKHLIINKFKQLSYEEVMYYSDLYGVFIEEQEAKAIANYLSNESIDPFNEHDQIKVFNKIAYITSQEKANKAKDVLNSLAKSYGFSDFLK